ncbi:hypothetical protein JCM17380_32030 [Desulfosporosinus burensis]
MGNCCDPKAPKLVTLIVGGSLVGLIGVEQAFLDVSSLELEDGEVAEKLLQIVAQRNYIANGTERDYKIALLAAYNSYLAKSR